MGEEHDFAERLRQLIDRANITAYGLAKRSGVSTTLISKLLLRKARPSWDTAVTLAYALGVSVAAFDPGPYGIPDAKPAMAMPRRNRTRTRRRANGDQGDGA